MTATDCIRIARAAMLEEASAIRAAAERLEDSFAQAVRLLLSHDGKVVITGMGKSGHIAAKIAATLSSTGIPAVYLHPSEALHGDIGLVSRGDPVVLLSNSGATPELLSLMPCFRNLGCTVVALLGNLRSPLARDADIVIDARAEREADPLALAPTASAAVALAIGDAIASALMDARGFTAAEFAACHPNGQLGRNLCLLVRDVMHTGHEVAWVAPDDSVRQLVIAMTERPLGAACVVSPEHCLLGLVTEGDLRRALRAHDDVLALRTSEIMTARPVTIGPGASLLEAVRLMEDRPSQISILPVVEPDGLCAGVIRVHDIYRAG